eukprot:6175283-Pleurochrysis_carterae.AAC.1
MDAPAHNSSSKRAIYRRMATLSSKCSSSFLKHLGLYLETIAQQSLWRGTALFLRTQTDWLRAGRDWVCWDGLNPSTLAKALNTTYPEVCDVFGQHSGTGTVSSRHVVLLKAHDGQPGIEHALHVPQVQPDFLGQNPFFTLRKVRIFSKWASVKLATSAEKRPAVVSPAAMKT